MDNLRNVLRDPRVKIYEVGGDICQTDILDSAMKGVDYVIHFAALWLLQCYEYPRAAFDVNIRGTFTVLEACTRHKIKKLIYSSSASVYGDAIEIPMTENHPHNNKTFYGATKIAGKQMCRAFHHRYGLNYGALRYMNVYGPRQDYKGVYIAVIMKSLDRLDQELLPIVYGDGCQSYDFVHVSDVARANVCGLEFSTTDQFYNIRMGTQTSIKELCEIILKITGKDYQIQFESTGQTFVTNRVGSSEKAKKDLEFEAAITLEGGLRLLIEWRRGDHRSTLCDRI